ncbi:hypothetical protein K493DRAFT_318548 [Basidiobolus meristosporus CBS 931.73]|uniref:Kaptin n=1 Tax=Basidiobolus meristosporus CBS 931.73 TaxID=1314790 RepID=A0A1Y1XWE2_9FUNG|nr:hypothetical protein K493DRAFT_318548 [Basidiobolus meristosporus CBS 931.73]|eukprot:ORX89644.1 hypothetical protein K493DRAFT_318548 [Basidiobolus meristosporus CBS 931.73]
MPPTYEQFNLLDLRHDNELYEESHFESFPKGGRTNIYGVTTFSSILPPTKSSRSLANLYPQARHTLISSFTGLTGFLSDEGRWKRVDIELPKENGEIISIDAFEVAFENETSASLVVATSVAKIDEETHESRFFLNIYGLSCYNTTIEANFDQLPEHFQQIPLDYVPAQISHLKLNRSSPSDTGFLLCGSDGKVHVYHMPDGKEGFEEIPTSEIGELSSLADESLNILYIKSYQIQDKKVLVIGCQDGHLLVNIAQPDGTSQMYKKRLYSPVLSVIPFTTSSQPTADAKINLLVACAVEYACVYEAVDTFGLTKSCSLEKCGEFDSILCAHIGDVDLDGQQEIILGTYGQQLLVYKYDVRLIDRLAFKLVWKRAFAYPLYHIRDIDLDLDGLNELLVTSMYGVHILKVDLAKSRDRLQSVILFLKEKKIQREMQLLSVVPIEADPAPSEQGESSVQADESSEPAEDEDGHSSPQENDGIDEESASIHSNTPSDRSQ